MNRDICCLRKKDKLEDVEMIDNPEQQLVNAAYRIYWEY